jgi:hypothetical protein
MTIKFIALCAAVLATNVPAAQAQQPLQNMWGSTGQYRGSTERNGAIYSPDGRFVGQVQRQGSSSGAREGGFGRGGTPEGLGHARRQADQDRSVYGANGQYLGQVDRSGKFYDPQGTYRGQLR